MAKEKLKSPRARLFVALDLPDRVRAEIVEWGHEALADPALRRVKPESLHITLAFLGYRPEQEPLLRPMLVTQMGGLQAAERMRARP